ncbi:MAG TPA: hypothetical protein VI316_04625 [Candidatus Dormibacteraeota bacterium]
MTLRAPGIDGGHRHSAPGGVWVQQALLSLVIAGGGVAPPPAGSLA